jgi:Protein of unknown function (DUF4239)
VFYWIYDISSESLATLFAVVFVGFTWFGTIFFRPFLRLFVGRHQHTNDILGNVLSCYCVFYGLLIGLVAVAAYQNYTSVEEAVNREASSLEALYRDTTAYPEPTRSAMQSILAEYTRFLIEVSWPTQRRGKIAEGASIHLSALAEVLRIFEPETKSQEILHGETISQFNHFAELRRLRLLSVTTGIPAFLWYVVFIGALVNIVMLWLFDMRLVPHLFLGGLLAFFIGTVICLIAVMDNPFRGEVSVSSDAFRQVYESLMSSHGSLTAN